MRFAIHSFDKFEYKGIAYKAPASDVSILEKLMASSPDFVEKNELLEAGWGDTGVLRDSSLPVAISRLRKLLENTDIEIRNIRGKGYSIRFFDEGEMSSESSSGNINETSFFYIFSTLTFSLLLRAFVMMTVIYILSFFHSSYVDVDCLFIENELKCQRFNSISSSFRVIN
ncbi:transcriptional regulator [Vibrio sp. 10N.261.52.C2]|uniref:winged helix-turn-helix domain-containing protein n=1 Tax=Vibrio sp. 10N.261.52.C2 TaxID=3229681 RepID=UPI0035539F6A